MGHLPSPYICKIKDKSSAASKLSFATGIVSRKKSVPGVTTAGQHTRLFPMRFLLFPLDGLGGLYNNSCLIASQVFSYMRLSSSTQLRNVVSPASNSHVCNYGCEREQK